MSDQPDDRPMLPALVSGTPIRPIVPSDFNGAWRIASAVCRAKMNPRGLDTPEQCTIAIMHGLEVGLPPMMALQSIAMINGRPSIYGDGALGLVQASGKLETIKETVGGQGDNRTAICTVKRRGDPEPKVGTFSVADAKLAGLWQKKGSPWVTYPDRMLRMRARAWALRDGFADVLKGLAVAEEQRDIPIDDTPVQPPRPPQPPKGLGAEPPVSSVQRMPPRPPKPPQPPVKAPEQEEEVPEEQTPEASLDDMLTELDEAMGTAADAQQVQEIWDGYGIEEWIEDSMPVAQAIRRKHLRRFE